MMKFVICLAVLFAITTAEVQSTTHTAVQFGRFAQKYGKSYESASEQAYRFRVYQQNVEFINNHNAKNLPYKLEVNHFADLTHSEFRERFLGFRANKTRTGRKHIANTSSVPKSVDWRVKGAVTDVKDQGQCGSCWSFSTTGSVEGAWFLAKGKLVSLSEQQLVDCSGDHGNQGCNGGLMDNAFQYIIDNNGIDTEKSYPYTAEEGTCEFKKANVAATISSYKDITSGDETALMTAVAQQPVSVAIDASQRSFQFYSTGVYYDENCSSEQLDHGVLAVGYGTDSASGKDYWIVKNSWGPKWGDKGFIKMSRNSNNNCGIATAASYPVV